MALGIREKTTLQVEARDIKKQLKTGGLKLAATFNLQKRWREILKLLKGGVKADTLIPDFVAGKFNDLPMDKFFLKIDEVEAAGAGLEQLKEGSRSWVVHNAESLDLAA